MKVLQLNYALKESILNTARSLIDLLEGYDSFLGKHSKRVTILTLGVGEKMKLSKEEMQRRRQCEARVGIPNLKPGMELSSNLCAIQGKLVFGKGSQMNSVCIEKLKSFRKTRFAGFKNNPKSMQC